MSLRPAYGLDGPAVQTWLLDNVDGLEGPCEFEFVSGGQSNLTFAGRDGHGERFVVRRPPLHAVLQSAHDMAREHRIIAALGPSAVPVPRALGLCDDVAVTGAMFYVMAFVDGDVIRDEDDAVGLTVDVRRRVGETMADALAALHAVDPDAVGLGDLGRREHYVERQLRRWSSQWETAAGGQGPEIVRDVHARLAAAVPPQRRTTIVHGDFRIDNVVLSHAGEVAAVLDWELCTLGDPLADLGTLLVNWMAPGEPTGHLLSGAPTAAGGFIDREALITRYAAASGTDVSDVDYFVAFGLWRLACIAEGIRARRAAGAMGELEDAEPVDWATKVTGLARAAAEVLDAR